jgi:hypothetical protein
VKEALQRTALPREAAELIDCAFNNCAAGPALAARRDWPGPPAAQELPNPPVRIGENGAGGLRVGRGIGQAWPLGEIACARQESSRQLLPI